MPRTETKFAVRCTEAEKAAIAAQAAGLGMSLAAFVRHALSRSEADVRAAEHFVARELGIWRTHDSDGGYGMSIHPDDEPYLDPAVAAVGAHRDGLTVFLPSLAAAVELEGLLARSRQVDVDTGDWAVAFDSDYTLEDGPQRAKIIAGTGPAVEGLQWAALGPNNTWHACRRELLDRGWVEPSSRDGWWRAPEPLAMPEALARIRRAYAADIEAGRVTVEPGRDGDCIWVDGPGINGSVLYGVPLRWDDTGHWSK